MRVFIFALVAVTMGCRLVRPAGAVADSLLPTDGAIALRNGRNPIDLLGDGTPSEAFVAWRGNFNAHGHSSVAFYVRAVSDLDDTPIWQVVPRFGGPAVGEGGDEIVGTTEGADCRLRDLRLISHRGAPTELIIARRDLGASYADAAPTHFDYYRLIHNVDGMVGRPPYYFEFSRTVEARRSYCDVNVAFDQELGLGRLGTGHAEARHGKARR